ncbi:hypothetical protein [Streptomyces bacillaris]|uniref:hypothetical protein n=1 Tax=Streptomyces bacillaris TaxID=68179 RepID=UPI0036365618
MRTSPAVDAYEELLFAGRETRIHFLVNDCQSDNTISLGPGIDLGRRCRIASGVTLDARIVPDDTAITAPHTADVHLRRRQDHRN